MRPYVLTWGGGDLATGVAIRLHRVGIRVLIVEAPQPMAVRRCVAFAQAVFDGQVTIEDVQGKLIKTPTQMGECWDSNQVPVLVDPELSQIKNIHPLVLVDARMLKIRSSLTLAVGELVIGLGPGFMPGVNCHAAIETNRGHFLGRVFWEEETQADTGIPGKVMSYGQARVLHTPVAGQVETFVAIGDRVNAGDPVLRVGKHEMLAPFTGIVRGLIYPGLHVKAGTKVGDIDPRPDHFRCWTVSEKSLAIGGGVLEAVLTKPELRSRLWD